MNIAIISPEFPPQTNWGGIARFNENLANLLVANGHNVHVITYGKNSTRTATKYKIHYASKLSLNRVIDHCYYLFLNILQRFLPRFSLILNFNLLAFFIFRNLKKQVDFDLIYSPSYHASTVLIHFFYPKIKIISHFQGSVAMTNFNKLKNFDLKLAIFVENYYIKNIADKIIYCSYAVRNRHLLKYKGIKNKTSVIHNFIDHSSYLNQCKINTNNLVYFGRIEYRKGVDVLLDAFINLAIKMPDLKLHIIGKSVKDFRCGKKLVEIHDLLHLKTDDKNILNRVYIHSEIDNLKKLINLLKKIKGIAIFPARYEPFGFTTIEAMAMGFVTVASLNGGAKEIITNGEDGFLIKTNKNNIVKIVNQIIKYKTKDLKKIGKMAQKTVSEKFSFNKMAELYKSI